MSIDNLPTVVSVVSGKNGFTFDICQSVKLTTHEQTTSPVMATTNTDVPIMIKSVETQTVEPVEAQTITIDPPILVEPVEAQTTFDPPIVVEPIETQTIINPPIVAEPVEAQTIIDPPIVVAPIEAQTIIDPPIVVEPVEAQTIIDPPIVVEPVEAQTIKIGRSIVVEPIEGQSNANLCISAKTNDKEFNENQIWFINYGKELQGHVVIDRELESHYFNIHTALSNTLKKKSFAILILEGYMMAFYNKASRYFLFI